MDRRGAVAAIILAIFVIGALAVYSVQTPIPTTALTLTVSGSRTTTSLPGRVSVVSTTGSQEVVCANASYFVPPILTTTTESKVQTYSAVNGDVTVIITETGYPQTTTLLETFASATNMTESAGYVVTSTSTYPGLAPSYGYSAVTCTYLP